MKRAGVAATWAALFCASVAIAEDAKEATGDKVSQAAIEFLDSASLIQYGFTFGVAGVVASSIKGDGLHQTDASLTAMPYVAISFQTLVRALQGRRIINKYCATAATRRSPEEASDAADTLALAQAKASSKEYQEAVAQLRYEESEFLRSVQSIDDEKKIKMGPATVARDAILESIKDQVQNGQISEHVAKARRAQAWHAYKTSVAPFESWFESEHTRLRNAYDARKKSIDDRFRAAAANALTRQKIYDETGWWVQGHPGRCLGTWYGAFVGFPTRYSGKFQDHSREEEERDVTSRGALGLSITPFPYLSVLLGITRTATSRETSANGELGAASTPNADDTTLDLGWSYVVGVGGNVDIFTGLFK